MNSNLTKKELLNIISKMNKKELLEIVQMKYGGNGNSLANRIPIKFKNTPNNSTNNVMKNNKEYNKIYLNNQNNK
jgi:hypothetical protein